MFRQFRNVMLPGLMTGAVLAGPANAAKIYRGPATRDPSYVMTPVVIKPWDRVRIETAPDPGRVPELLRGRFVGYITDINQSSVTVVLRGGQPAVIDRDLVEQLELGVGHGSRWKHAGFGMLIGGLFGAGLGLAAASESGSWIDTGPGAGIGAAFFGAIGLAVGSVLPAGEHWKSVPMERVQWNPDPAAGSATPHQSYE